VVPGFEFSFGLQSILTGVFVMFFSLSRWIPSHYSWLSFHLTYDYITYATETELLQNPRTDQSLHHHDWNARRISAMWV